MVTYKPWAPEENDLIERMVEEGASIAVIAENLPGRTPGAVEQQIRRLGLKKAVCVSEKKFSFEEIRAERVIEREEALKILAGAIERLQRGGEMNDGELFRLRTIIMAIRGYFAVFNSYEKYAELEERVRRLEEDAGKDLEKVS